jgi:hypothetical protein
MSTEHTDKTVMDGTGNVFADLGIALTEQEMLKVSIASAITKVIQRRGLHKRKRGRSLASISLRCRLWFAEDWSNSQSIG